MLAWLNRQSIATRLFLSAALWSAAILLVAGVALSAIYRRSAEEAFDTRLGFYLKALVADVAAPADDRATLGQLGEPQFELTYSGWYWQITRLGQAAPGPGGDVRASRSLFAGRLARLPVPDNIEFGVRKGYVTEIGRAHV